MSTTPNAIDEATRAAAPLLEKGYALSETLLADNFFGNGLAIFAKDGLHVRLVKDRMQWRIDVGSTGDPQEWYDSSLVLSMIGEDDSYPIPEDHEAVRAAVARLAAVAWKWELLFQPTVYAETKARLKAAQRALAKKYFNYP
jgi:hypothetical protein